jgi:hypothetical protein
MYKKQLENPNNKKNVLQLLLDDIESGKIDSSLVSTRAVESIKRFARRCSLPEGGKEEDDEEYEGKEEKN